jgi:plastocyanin
MKAPLLFGALVAVALAVSPTQAASKHVAKPSAKKPPAVMHMASTMVPTAASEVTIKNFAFGPMALTVSAGTTVTWHNKDGEPHTVVSADGLFRSAALDTDESFSFKFTKAGTFKYVCTIHPRMVATITVK